MVNFLNLFVLVLRKHSVASYNPASCPNEMSVLLEEELEYGAVLLLLEFFVVEDLVDLSAIDLSERGAVAFRLPSFEGEVIY